MRPLRLKGPGHAEERPTPGRVSGFWRRANLFFVVLLYSELAAWWPILSPHEAYAPHAQRCWRLLQSHATRPIRTILELGAGGGHLSHHLWRISQACMTLTDLSPQMLALSRTLNPGCEHIAGDMRSLRLDRTFDLVVIHDAVMHMNTAADLRAAIATSHAHCAPGGLALFLPDWTRETFRPGASLSGSLADSPARDDTTPDSDRGLQARLVEWTWDPDLTDTEFHSHMTYILRRQGAPTRVEHETLRLGLFSRNDWLAMLRASGFTPLRESLAHEGIGSDVFLGFRQDS